MAHRRNRRLLKLSSSHRMENASRVLAFKLTVLTNELDARLAGASAVMGLGSPPAPHHALLSAEYPVAFTSLLSKVLPMQIGGSTDEGDGINITVNFTSAKPKIIEHAPRFIDPER